MFKRKAVNPLTTRETVQLILAAVFLAAVVAIQSAAFGVFIAGVETWIAPGLFPALGSFVTLPLGLVLFVLMYACFTTKTHAGLMALAFLATAFVFGLEGYHQFS